uniref:Uncharacterized protein n=1 Tax=Cacopsylla melanoneura TaxID=428564 RepID=A0A8D8Y9R1_9HEMI
MNLIALSLLLKTPSLPSYKSFGNSKNCRIINPKILRQFPANSILLLPIKEIRKENMSSVSHSKIAPHQTLDQMCNWLANVFNLLTISCQRIQSRRSSIMTT